MNGDIYVNGEKIKNINKFRNKIGYVTQFNNLPPRSTPFENFTFVANMIYSNKLSKKGISDMVEETIKFLSLERCRNTIIGNDEIRGLSGGERKRVEVGIEIIGNPSLLFMDEPTTGLDASTALDVMKLARMLARQNKTIITTIHQPSFEILDCFDNILTLVQGNIVYWGPPRGIPGYFAEMGLIMPALTNPADFMMRVVNEDDILTTNKEARRAAKELVGISHYANKGLQHDEKKSTTSSSVASIVKLKREFKKLVDNNPLLKKIDKSDVKRLFQERIDLFVKTYQKFKKTYSFEYDPNKETNFKKLSVKEKGQGFCSEFGTIAKRDYQLYFRDEELLIGLVGMWVSLSIFHIMVYNSMTKVTEDTLKGIHERTSLLYSLIT